MSITVLVISISALFCQLDTGTVKCASKESLLRTNVNEGSYRAPGGSEKAYNLTYESECFFYRSSKATIKLRVWVSSSPLYRGIDSQIVQIIQNSTVKSSKLISNRHIYRKAWAASNDEKICLYIRYKIRRRDIEGVQIFEVGKNLKLKKAGMFFSETALKTEKMKSAKLDRELETLEKEKRKDKTPKKGKRVGRLY